MNLAMKFAVKLLNRLFTRMPDGSTDVPLWRYKGTKVPLNLNRFHPWGCAAHVHVEKKKRTRFEPKSTPCVFFGYDDAASAAILAKLPDFTILYSAHAHYNDEDFPCRKFNHKGWEPSYSYDLAEEDPFTKWLGNGQERREPAMSPPDTELSAPMYPLPGCYPDAPTDFERMDRRRRILADPQEETKQQRPAQVVTDASPAMSPEVHKGLRRSSRPWRPSAAALEHIAAKDMSRDVAALIDDILVQDDDQVFHAGVQNPFFVSDLAHATQDLEVPRSYAQILRLPEPEKTKWLQACQRESKSHLDPFDKRSYAARSMDPGTAD